MGKTLDKTLDLLIDRGVVDVVCAAVDAFREGLGGVAIAALVGLAVAHVAAGRLGSALACAWCALGQGGKRGVAALAALAVVETDYRWLRMATDAEGDAAWLARHACAFGAVAALTLRFASEPVWVFVPEGPRRSWAALPVFGAAAAVAGKGFCVASAATSMDALLGGAFAAAAAAAVALAAARSCRGHLGAAALMAAVAASSAARCERWCGGGAPQSLVGELHVADHPDLASLFDAAVALIGDEADYRPLIDHPRAANGGAASEHAYHRRRAAADFAGEAVPLLQDLVVELRHRKRELRALAGRYAPFGAAPLVDELPTPDEACVRIRDGNGTAFDRACNTGIGTAWKLRGTPEAMGNFRRLANRVLATNVSRGYHLNSLFYPPDSFAMWHANSFDTAAYRLYLVRVRGNASYAYVDDGGATVRAPDRDGVARVFRIDACARRWHSIVVDDGSRWSFGFMLPQAKALELLGRAA